VARKTVIRHRDIIIAVVASATIIATTLLVHVLTIAPINSRAAREQQKVSATVQKIEACNAELRQLKQARQENDDLRARLSVFDARVPQKNDVAGLFAKVLRMADTDELKILRTQPAAPVDVGQGLLRFPYEVEVQGDYHRIARFVAGIESHASFIKVTRTALFGQPDQTIRARISISLYGTDDTRPRATPSAAG
jgi:type IV pilus assembly protein PilO